MEKTKDIFLTGKKGFKGDYMANTIRFPHDANNFDIERFKKLIIDRPSLFYHRMGVWNTNGCLSVIKKHNKCYECGKDREKTEKYKGKLYCLNCLGKILRW